MEFNLLLEIPILIYSYFVMLLSIIPNGGAFYDNFSLDNVSQIFLRDNYSDHKQLGAQQMILEPSVSPAKAINTVDLAVYIEAQCSDTTRFVHRQLLPVWEAFSSTKRISLKIVPFGKAKCHPVDDDYYCECQHGPSECELNQLMNCVIEMIVDPHGYMPTISCIQGRHDLSTAGSKCLSKLHMPTKKIMRCANGVEGRKLLAKAGAETERLQPPLHFVPWITINGKRSADAFYDLKKNLCDALDPKPHQCQDA